jgi:hypothetical protein
VTSDARLFPYPDKEYCCCYVSRRDKNRYVHTHEEILAKYGSRMVMCERIPEILSGAMGNQMYTAKVPSQDAVDEFIHFVLDQAVAEDMAAEETDVKFCLAY